MPRFWQLFRCEARSLFRDRAILLTLFGGLLFYSLLYPLPYAHQVARQLPVLLVDQDHSQLSRRLAFMADATPQLRLVGQADSIPAAAERIRRGEAKGILVIPRDFYRDVRLGRSVTLGLAGDGAYYLIYGAIAEGLTSAAGSLGAQVRISRLLAEGQSLPGATSGWRAFAVNAVPVFNPGMGYQQYVVPAVFLFILHQTLLIGAGLQGARQNEARRRHQPGYWYRANAFSLLLARLTLFFLLYVGFACFYLGPCYNGYGLSQLAAPGTLLLFLVPYLLAAGLLGILFGAWLPRREMATGLVILSSLPILFVVGFIWPAQMLPAPMHWIANVLPATPGILGVLRLEAMGADWAAVEPLWWQLWAQVLGIGAMAWWSLDRRVCQPLS